MSKKRPHIEGTFFRNEKGYGFVKLAMEDKKDIYIAENHTKGAMNQDIVWIELLSQEEEGKSAEEIIHHFYQNVEIISCNEYDLFERLL